MPLEQLIQPLFSPLYQDRVIPSNTKQPVSPARLRWGTAGPLPVAQQQNPASGINFKVISNKTWTQWGQPVTETVTVTNPADSSQSVDVQRVKSIQFVAPDQQAPPSSQTGTLTPPSPPAPEAPNPSTGGVYTSLTPVTPGQDIDTYNLSFADDA